MKAISDGLIALLASAPQPVLAAGRLGLRSPAGPSDLPAVVIALHLREKGGACLNRFVREGHQLVKHESALEVNPVNPVFSADLTTLRVEPLPVRKNPSSLDRNFGPDDLQVQNVSLGSVDYKMLKNPGERDEFTFAHDRAEIRFGQSQKSGEKLKVTHWTLSWREDITSDSFHGSAMLEIWATNAAEAEGLVSSIQKKLRQDRAELRRRGFYRLDPGSLEPASAVLQTPTVGSAFPVWKQRLGYRFDFELEEGGEATSGTVIRQVKVDMQRESPEDFSVPR